MNTGLSKEIREHIAERLQILLASEFVLLVKTYKFHWNVKGPHFGPLHKLFEEGYEMILPMVDEIAERIVQLGFPAPSTLHEFLHFTFIKESIGSYPSAQEMLQELCADHEMMLVELRKEVDITDSVYRDMPTSDFLIGLMQKHEKYAWFLRAHLT